MLESAFDTEMPCEIDGHGVNYLHKDPEQRGEYYIHIKCQGCGSQSVLLACSAVTHEIMKAIYLKDQTALDMCPDCDYRGTLPEFVISFTKKQAL